MDFMLVSVFPLRLYLCTDVQLMHALYGSRYSYPISQLGIYWLFVIHSVNRTGDASDEGSFEQVQSIQIKQFVSLLSSNQIPSILCAVISLTLNIII